jgi:hypothetical protein
MKLKLPATKPPNRLHINYDGNRDTPSLCGATGTYWNMFSTWESRQGNYTYCPECDRIAKLIQGHADKLKTKLANLKQMLGD